MALMGLLTFGFVCIVVGLAALWYAIESNKRIYLIPMIILFTISAFLFASVFNLPYATTDLPAEGHYEYILIEMPYLNITLTDATIEYPREGDMLVSTGDLQHHLISIDGIQEIIVH